MSAPNVLPPLYRFILFFLLYLFSQLFNYIFFELIYYFIGKLIYRPEAQILRTYDHVFSNNTHMSGAICHCNWYASLYKA